MRKTNLKRKKLKNKKLEVKINKKLLRLMMGTLSIIRKDAISTVNLAMVRNLKNTIVKK
jgi:hypothetical protein